MNSPQVAHVEDVRTAPPPQRRRHGWRWVLIVFILLVILFAVAAVWGNRSTTPTREPQHVQSTPEQLKQGEYLARAANCISCHTSQGGTPFAGGYPLSTGFGTIYGTNITSDPDHGIGRWTAEEFHRAVTSGTAPGSRQLYPAMPFASYHQMTRADTDLIYGYLLHTRPSGQANQAPDMHFPFNLRVLMLGWKALFLRDAPLPAASQGQSQAWLRGQYLGNVMGHCAECHTPRGSFGQMDKSEWQKGGTLSLYKAPDITAAGLAARGWTPEDLSSYLRQGYAPQGSAFDEMHEVVANSTRYLSQNDNAALVAFLLGEPPVAAAPAPAIAAPADGGGALAMGRGHYMAMCSACHGADGLGRDLTMPPLRGNSTLRQADGHNLILSILVGLPKRHAPDGGLAQLPGMPGFGDKLSDADIAALANYARSTLGGAPADITAEKVASLRAAANKQHIAIAP